MMEIKTTIPMKIEVLSPVHIGNGYTLKRDLDFVTQSGKTYVIDESKFINWAFPDEDQIDSQLLDARPGDLLANERDLDSLPIWRYVMRGVPEKAELTAHIKYANGSVYIPGSSIKGMLRTAFVRGLYVIENKSPALNKLSRNRKWAGQSVERQVMGRNPNYDLFRAIQVADTQPVALDSLRVRGTSVFPTSQRNREGVIIDAEVIREKTVFDTSMTLDRYGFDSPEAAQVLNWTGKEQLIEQTLVPALQDAARIRLMQERRYFREREVTKAVAGYYSGLVDQYKQLEGNQFIAQVGWGAGWNSKTLNDLLLADERQFAQLVRDYRLQARQSSGFKPGDEFPVSRTLVRQEGRLVRPMGWVLVSLG